MPGFWNRVRKVVEESHVVLEVVDARFPEQTRNRELERKVLGSGKKLIIVLNKADLVSKNTANKIKKELSKECPVVFVSALKRQGQSMLRKAILRTRSSGEITVGIVGYPNTGKSSLVNLLHGRKVAGTARKAGFTRGEQWVKLGRHITLVDTPGIIPYEEREEKSLVLINAKSGEQVRDVEAAGAAIVQHVLQHNFRALEKQYSIALEGAEEADEVLEKIARSRNRLRKGNTADTQAAARMVIQDWQKGKLKI